MLIQIPRDASAAIVEFPMLPLNLLPSPRIFQIAANVSSPQILNRFVATLAATIFVAQENAMGISEVLISWHQLVLINEKNRVPPHTVVMLVANDACTRWQW